MTGVAISNYLIEDLEPTTQDHRGCEIAGCVANIADHIWMDALERGENTKRGVWIADVSIEEVDAFLAEIEWRIGNFYDIADSSEINSARNIVSAFRRQRATLQRVRNKILAC
jgi:hypothetical protein